MNIVIITIAMTVAAVALITGFLILSGRPVDVQTDQSLQGLPEDLCEVLYLGSLAPSSHNIQSLRVSVYPSEEKIVIAADPTRKLDVVDPDGRELHISLGCYIKTLQNAFTAYGYETTLRYDPADGTSILHYYGKKEAGEPALAEAIRIRHTDKSAFDPEKRVTQADFDALPFDHTGVSCFTRNNNGSYSYENAGFRAITEASMTAYEKQAYDADAAKELAKWLRFSDRETLEKRDGLPAEQLGLSGIKKSLYYLFTDRESAQGESFAKQGIDTTRKQLEGCAGFVVIASGYSKQELIECGMKTVDVWMALTRAGISVQPMSYALEDPDSRKKLEDALGITNPQMILRIGYASEYGRNNAIRREPTDYISVY